MANERLKLDKLKPISRNSITLLDQLKQLQTDAPTIVLRSFEKAPTLPMLESGVEVSNLGARPASDLAKAYGTRPNVPGTEVISAIINALGSGNWSLHSSDGSWTAYSAWELQSYMSNFDSTNLLVWIEETFDCDNFATVLNGAVQGFFKGIPFGVLWFGPKNPPYNWGHAVNIFYDATQKKVYCVEPQNDSFFIFDKNKWKPWMVCI